MTKLSQFWTCEALIKQSKKTALLGWVIFFNSEASKDLAIAPQFLILE
jgi:hypothetical protein